MALTRRQREVLDAIRHFIASNGYSPSLEEIGGRLNLSSVATVHKHVSHLVEKGYLRRSWNQNRSIELVEKDETPGAVSLPLLGALAAGRSLEPSPTPETVRVPSDMLLGRGSTYVLRVEGDSMADEYLREGDLVVVEDRNEARDGETVIALLDGGADVALKRFFRGRGEVRLQPASGTAPRVVAADRVRVHGIVVGVIRNY